MDTFPDERIVLLIDGAALHSTARTLGLDIDFGKLLDLFGAGGRLVRAYYYAAVPDDREFSSMRPLLDWLDPKSGSCSWSGFAEALVELGDERICRGPRGSPCG